MTKAQIINQYFSLLDAGNVEEATAIFERGDQINSLSADGLEPSDFIATHVASASNRCHTILDLLTGENGDSAAAHFQYSS